VGDKVVVKGLQARPEFNEATAVVEGWDGSKGRYTVRILGQGEM